MSLPYRLAVALVLLLVALAFVVVTWDGFDCQPECNGPPWNCEDKP